MNLLKRNEKAYSFWFLLLTSLFFLLLRIPSLFEPYWYGDEGVYQAVAVLINSGADLYSGAWENKPPLLLIIYALLNSDQFLIRTLSLIFGIASIWFFFFISKKLFIKSKYAPYISTLFYALVFGTRLIEGNIANAENFMILPILISAYLILSGENLKKSRQALTYFSAGLLLSFAFLTKIVAVFDFLAFGFYLFINSLKDFKKDLIYKIIPLILGFSLPVFVTITYFFFTDHFKQFTDAFLFGNISYVGLNNNFIIPQGFLFLKAFMLFIFLLFIFLYRNKINKRILFISVWFAFSIFDAFFSQRPYTHYLIMLLPSFSLMVGAVIEFKKERLALATYLLITFIIVSFAFDFKGKIVDYYKNFILYASNNKNVDSYQEFFDINTPRDYKIASYIKNNTIKSDKVFIWGNNSQVYKLSGKTPLFRYTVAYHITGFPTGIEEMTKALSEQEPRLIVIMPNANEKFPLTLDEYYEKIRIDGAIIYERFF